MSERVCFAGCTRAGGSEVCSVLAGAGKPSFLTQKEMLWLGSEGGEGKRDPDPLSQEGGLTVFLAFGRQGPLVGTLQGAVDGELEPRVGEDGNQGGVQAFVEDQGAFAPVHGHHSISQGFIDLDTTRVMTKEVISAQEASPPCIFPRA